MSSALLLLAYAGLVAYVAGPALARSRYAARAPRSAISAWLLMCATLAVSLLAAAASALTAVPHLGEAIVSLVALCASTVRHVYAVPDGGHAATLLGPLVLLLVPVRLTYVLAKMLAVDRHGAGRLIDALAPVMSRLPGSRDVFLLDRPERLAFCVPGRHKAVVLTSGLVNALSGPQLSAILAHERSHLDQHHALTLLLARAFRRSFGNRVHLFALAEQQIAHLIELCADDAARREVGSLALKQALQQVARGPVPGSVLAAAAVAVEERVARLDQGTAPESAPAAVSSTIALVVLLASPVVVALVPIASTVWYALCH